MEILETRSYTSTWNNLYDFTIAKYENGTEKVFYEIPESVKKFMNKHEPKTCYNWDCPKDIEARYELRKAGS